MEVRCNKPAKGISMNEPSCFITNLPNPILMEILCRLPIKTLTASKCVCKSWLDLSRDPEFTQLHQARAPIEVILKLDNDKDSIKLHMGNFHCLSNFDPLDVKLNTLFEIPKFSVRSNNTLDYGDVSCEFTFNNSCNGLLCYNAGHPNWFVVVWNPCTSEFITLPALTPAYCRYGFGFSRKANKYKLLRLVLQISNETYVAEILTIEKGCSWNTLGPGPSSVGVLHYFYSSIFLHGTLHWPDIWFSPETHIPTFDFEDEQFGSVPLPPSVGNERTSQVCRVGESSGCLFITESTGKGLNVWLMKEYGVQDSWTKMYSLPCTVIYMESVERIDESFFIPLTCMDNGEILLAHNKFKSTSVFSYNPDLEGFRRIGYGRGFLRVIAYRPSLVQLKNSMLGYEVHNVSASKHREMSKTPDWWTPWL